MNNYNPKENNIVVALDIGTTKVCAIAGRYNEHKRIDILAVGRVDSEGVSRGVISNIEKTAQAIHSAIALVENAIKSKVDRVYVGIAGQHIRSMQHRGQIFRDNSVDEISKRDIDRLVADMHKLILSPGETILHVIPQEYAVDNEQGIIDPIGMSGSRLEADFHVITGQVAASNNINRCVSERNKLTIAELTLEPIASSKAVL
ncbi:MAG: cell division protein FtsA, partial [Saprospiraceae bacterium]